MSTSKATSRLNLFERFKKPSNQKAGVTVFVSKKHLYALSDASPQSEVVTVPFEGSDWASAFGQALNAKEVKGKACTVILGSEHYQTYQIETPKVPKEEWPVALPFLLKDVIAERINDVVADAVELPNQNKAQAYVYKRAQLESLLAACEGLQLELTQVLPDYEVWAQVDTEQLDYLLLLRAQSENYSVAAFSQGRSVFQRGIRGVVGPLTSSPAGGLQFDSLALEVQRSVDYLSASVKQAHFNHLFLACDEEDLSQLEQELSSRLSVKVAPLQESFSSVGELLARSASGSFEVNLYPSHLRPQKERFSLATVLGSWLLIALVMGGVYGAYRFQADLLRAEHATVEMQLEQLTEQQSQLQQRLARHLPSKDKQQAIERIELDIEAKRISINAVSGFDDSEKLGFSKVMAALANIDNDNIALTAINIDANKLSVKGLAKTPASVPTWVSVFKQEVSLIGRSFERLEIGRNEDDIVTFKIDAKAER